jgi:hypothetical protein
VVEDEDLSKVDEITKRWKRCRNTREQAPLFWAAAGNQGVALMRLAERRGDGPMRRSVD